MKAHPLLAIALLLTSCGGAEQYYRLSAEGAAPLRTAGVAVGIGPVELPGYVDRAELVFQSDANEYQVPAKVRWAGPLGENFTRVLATDVGRRLNSGNVAPYPWPNNAKLRYQVSVQVRQFHAVSGGEAILDASWRVEDAASHQVIRTRNGSFHERIAGDGYGPVVAAESRLVEQLAAAIAVAVNEGR